VGKLLISNGTDFRMNRMQPLITQQPGLLIPSAMVSIVVLAAVFRLA
jgi:hypothetical protein